MRVLWFTFRARRRTWRVYLVDRLECGGNTHLDRHRIDIWAGSTYQRIVEVLGHELFHVICDQCIAEPEEHAAEERFARRCESSFWPILACFGARIPAFPDGFRKVRASARRKAN